MSSVWIEENLSSLFRLHRVTSFQRYPLCKAICHSMDRVTRSLIIRRNGKW